eukprot:CAMPEP_0172318352 /NCGR_PEP_ID=MMETSP1058-20130122/34672_1 /TAXON_ID=83371 /ORGANISM="Detonula confervacea, Strain CCMP 353" /LENGTH=689 /DNA_ID=CAMNT_0013033177 /DNA_START=195 /DNA_END=2264 /DNA_ORIENTATION=-
MVYGIARGPPVDEATLTSFVQTLSALPVEEWRKRIDALKELVDSIPDYSTTPLDENGERANDGVAPMTPSSSSQPHRNNGNKNQIIPWYRSSKSLRRLALPLKSLLLDARSAVVKEATELIGTLMMVKLQSHPSLTTVDEGGDTKDGEAKNNGGLETISGGLDASKKIQQPPPPAFVGRLLFKDLLPAILDLSKQTVKLIRMYGVNMTIDILPHCRVKSCIVVLLERMKTHQNRTVREDCARYLRCVLETWPWDPTGSDNISNDDIGIVNSRKEERLSLDSARQIGLGLGRTLSDSAKPVREEAKRGFQVLFRRFRPVWDEVMSSGVVRDIRLRKKLYEAASHSDGKLFDDMASLGEMSLNSAVSGLSYASYRSHTSHRSYASRGMASNGVPTVIGTPKVSPRVRSRARCSPSSPSYMRGTGSSATRIAEQAKIQAKEASDKYSINEYVTSTGHVLSTPSPRKGKHSKPSTLYGGEEAAITAQQPFASLLQTPNRPMSYQSPVSTQNSCDILKRRLSRRISGIKDEISEHVLSPSHLTSINETDDSNGATPSTIKDSHSSEITNVTLEVIAAHLSHIEQIETLISKEKDLLLDLNKQLGISITDGTKTAELSDRLASLSEEQVCDYFESVHICVDTQRNVGEEMLKEMEQISQGDGLNVSGIDTPESPQRQDLAQSPLGPDLALQRNLF